MNRTKFFEPSDEYKIACCRTIYLRRKLLDQSSDREIILPIFNGLTLEQTTEFRYDIAEDEKL